MAKTLWNICFSTLNVTNEYAARQRYYTLFTDVIN